MTQRLCRFAAFHEEGVLALNREIRHRAALLGVDLSDPGTVSSLLRTGATDADRARWRALQTLRGLLVLRGQMALSLAAGGWPPLPGPLDARP